jgi:hypothetical protein
VYGAVYGLIDQQQHINDISTATNQKRKHYMNRQKQAIHKLEQQPKTPIKTHNT